MNAILKNALGICKKVTDPCIDFIDKKLEKFDPVWQAEHGTGGLRSRYPDDGSGIPRYREWRGVRDTFQDYVAWLRNVGYMGAMAAKSPVHVVKGIWEYRWMGSFLGSFQFVDRIFEGYRGRELDIANIHGNAIVRILTLRIGLILANDRRLGGGPMSDFIIGLDETVPPLFTAGFPTLNAEPMQTMPEFVVCDVDQNLDPYYIAVAESYGLAPDVVNSTCLLDGRLFRGTDDSGLVVLENGKKLDGGRLHPETWRQSDSALVPCRGCPWAE